MLVSADDDEANSTQRVAATAERVLLPAAWECLGTVPWQEVRIRVASAGEPVPPPVRAQELARNFRDFERLEQRPLLAVWAAAYADRA